MPSITKTDLVKHFRQSLVDAGLKTDFEDSLICPLCWEERRFNELTLEHVVPRAVGGTHKTVTCRSCNNTHGSQLDSHLVSFQVTRDALLGKGTLNTRLDVNGNRMVANLEMGQATKNFRVVGKATNPKAEAAIKEDFAAGKVSKVTCTFSYGYSTSGFEAAVLRAAYLVLFDRLGYKYVVKDNIQALRRRVCDQSIEQPGLNSLIIELRAVKMPRNRTYLLVPCKVGETDCVLVIIRIRRAETTYLAVFMPNSDQPIAEFFALMEQSKRDNNGKSIAIPRDGFFV